MNPLGWKRLWSLWLPLLSTPTLLALCLWAGGAHFGLAYPWTAAGRDLAWQTVLAWGTAFFSRRPLPFLILQTLWMGCFFLAMAAKTAFHGVPPTLDDVFALDELFWILSPAVRFAACLLLVGWLGLWLWNLRYGRAAAAAAGMLLLALILPPDSVTHRLVQVLESRYGGSVWDQRGNLVYRGATLHAVMDGARYLYTARPAPDAAAVAEALAGLGGLRQARVDDPPMNARNVHLILLESFWDPSPLEEAGFDREPFDPRFARLWEAGGRATVLTPVFGGYTANAEFEALCGFPVTEDGIKFERGLRNAAPCLPRRLAECGYAAVAAHPNVAGFWNRTNAYRRLGFDTYWAIDDFVLDDMNGAFLSDASLYRQVTEKITPWIREGGPVFSYVVTYFGHWDYPLNESRPPKVATRSTVPEVEAFANTVYYKSGELVDHIAALQEIDPDAIIVAFGDHPPYLGENFAGYVESGLLATRLADFNAEMFRLSHEAPLLVIDGRNGAVPLGSLPLYRLPVLILSLLGFADSGIMDTAAPPQVGLLRPLPGVLLEVDGHGRAALLALHEGRDMAPETRFWLERVVRIGDDIFMGRQFSLPAPVNPLPALPPPRIRQADVAPT